MIKQGEQNYAFYAKSVPKTCFLISLSDCIAGCDGLCQHTRGACSISMTAVCWARVIGPPSGQGNFLAKYGVGAGTTPFYGMFHNSNNQVHAYVRDTGGTLVDPWSKDVINDDEWHHLALVRDTAAKKIYLYVDGNMDFEAADTTGDLTNDVPLAIGRHTGEFLVGAVDEVMVFRRALDEDEVNASMTPDTFMAVSATDKLATTWGEIKYSRH